ncbi:hypothetical protein OHA98_21670 [Streptomyces sp. NBC_00654]|uniref:hypothetical protein n=1 Tax=Streptomyces sp. NBC_00654 TaxID=2975799 RepID=UPI00225C0384|nr:hypothetical protein [Streptomyces sp. NBC_00654]MCX4967328.1 hypothetical protein [Streptomyces sp. NBC_00654]
MTSSSAPNLLGLFAHPAGGVLAQRCHRTRAHCRGHHDLGPDQHSGRPKYHYR